MHTLSVLLVTVLAGLLQPLAALSADVGAPYAQDFVITAYYSPKPDQCCYVRGSYEADKELNGNGTHGASGMPVHPGMAAAPKLYGFGTRIALPGIGTVTVEDRGGAINALPDGKHRLDLWVGEGEEGLARALAFGVQRVRGTVYPIGTEQPAESLVLDAFAAPWEKILTFLKGRETLMAVRPSRGERSASALLLQETLRDAGYFRREPTGFFAAETEESMRRFIADFRLGEPSDALTLRAAAFLLAAASVPRRDIFAATVTRGSEPERVRDLQRTLRFFGYYRGRTDGVYDGDVRRAVLAYQNDRGVIASRSDRGAGTAGPLTRKAVSQDLWKKKVARRAADLLLLARLEEHLRENGAVPNRFLARGDSGAEVRLLQSMLADRGFFPAERINGTFGPLTESAVLAYQLASGVIGKKSERGAGMLGPSTRQHFLADMRMELYAKVKAEGWEAL